jgi:hypothetical protein
VASQEGLSSMKLVRDQGLLRIDIDTNFIAAKLGMFLLLSNYICNKNLNVVGK